MLRLLRFLFTIMACAKAGGEGWYEVVVAWFGSES